MPHILPAIDAKDALLKAWYSHVSSSMTTLSKTATNVFYGLAPDSVQGADYVVILVDNEVDASSTAGGGVSGRTKLGTVCQVSSACWSKDPEQAALIAKQIKDDADQTFAVTGYAVIQIQRLSQTSQLDETPGLTPYAMENVVFEVQLRKNDA